DELVVPLGDAHHVADDLQGQAGGDLGDEVAAGAGDEEVVDDLLGGGLDVRLELLDHLGREGAGDDAPQAGVARVVHVDHGAEVLGELRGQVGDVRRAALPRGEDLRVAAGFEDVGVPHERVVAGALRGEG